MLARRRARKEKRKTNKASHNGRARWVCSEPLIEMRIVRGNGELRGGAETVPIAELQQEKRHRERGKCI